MSEQKNIYSHTQVTKSILRGFAKKQNIRSNGYCNKTDCVWCLDTSNNDSLSIQPIKKAGTIRGYFSEETEFFLSKEIETPFGNSLNKIRKEKTLTAADFSNIKKFVAFIIIRSPWYYKKSKIFEKYGLPHSEHILNPHTIKVISNRYLLFLEKYNIIIVNNKTKCNFIVSNNALTIVLFDDYALFMLPISTNIAIILDPQKKLPSHITCSKEDDILYLNFCTAYTEYRLNNRSLFAKEKKDLLWLKKVRSFIQKTSISPQDLSELFKSYYDCQEN